MPQFPSTRKQLDRFKEKTGQVAPAASPSPQDLIADLLDEERFKTRRDEEIAQIEEKRARDLQSGKDFISDFSLGRIEQTPLSGENEKLRSLLEGRLGGLSSGEGAALREQSFRGLNQQRQGDVRALRGIQGAQGVRGPAAVAQQQNVFGEAADRASDLEQQLLLRNIDIQRQAAGDFQSEVGRQQGQQLGISEFNIGQGTQEAALKNAFPFLFANLGAQEQATATGTVTGRDALIAALFPDLLASQQAGAGGVPGAPGAGIRPSAIEQFPGSGIPGTPQELGTATTGKAPQRRKSNNPLDFIISGV